jgi:3-oxoadipate enol-lactonase
MIAQTLTLATIVLLHGLGGDRHVWDGVVPKLGKHRVITIDMPPPGSLDEMAKKVAAQIRAQKAAPAIIVGHSLGGMVMAHVPLVDRGAASALVLVDIPIGDTWPPSEVAQVRDGLARDRDATLRGWFGSICKPPELARILSGVTRLSNDTIMGYVHAMATGGIHDGGRALGVPTLLMASKLVLPGKKPRAEELADAGLAHVAKLDVATFDDSMHWIMWNEPDKFVTTLLRFVEKS